MRAFVARLLSPLVWRIPGHDARKLFGFALAEHGSVIDLAAAARGTPSPARRARYLRHLLDETRHAEVFSRRSAELRAGRGRASFGEPRADTEALFERLGEVGFLAFVHRGERRGRAQFAVYRDWFARRGDERTRAMFDAILDDERRHEAYTRELLVELTGGEAAAGRALRQAARWSAWRAWRRAGRFVAERAYFVAMVALYLTLAPFALLLRLARPARTGWRRPPEEG